MFSIGTWNNMRVYCFKSRKNQSINQLIRHLTADTYIDLSHQNNVESKIHESTIRPYKFVTSFYWPARCLCRLAEIHLHQKLGILILKLVSATSSQIIWLFKRCCWLIRNLCGLLRYNVKCRTTCNSHCCVNCV